MRTALPTLDYGAYAQVKQAALEATLSRKRPQKVRDENDRPTTVYENSARGNRKRLLRRATRARVGMERNLLQAFRATYNRTPRAGGHEMKDLFKYLPEVKYIAMLMVKGHWQDEVEAGPQA